MLRDYAQDLDALVMAKPNGLNVQMIGMWQDHIGKAIMRKAGGDKAMAVDQETAVQDAEDRAIAECLTGSTTVFNCMTKCNLLATGYNINIMSLCLQQLVRRTCEQLSTRSLAPIWDMTIVKQSPTI